MRQKFSLFLKKIKKVLFFGFLYNKNDRSYMKKLIIQIILRLALIVIGVVGIILTASSTSFMGDKVTFTFFTVQSNITIILIELVYLVDAILQLFSKKSFSNNILLIIKYLFTVAITITFLVFVFMLAPTLDNSYLFSFNNYSLHFIVPIIALVDFFVFNSDIKLTKLNCLWGTAMPIYYVIYFLIGIPQGRTYLYGDHAPYFFLNYEKLTWFSFTENGPGVFYWILILTAGIVVLCYLFYFLMWLRQKLNKKV